MHKLHVSSCVSSKLLVAVLKVWHTVHTKHLEIKKKSFSPLLFRAGAGSNHALFILRKDYQSSAISHYYRKK